MATPLGEILLLRHGEVESHRGDVPLTTAGRQSSIQAGRALGAREPRPIRILTSPLRRCRETAEGIAEGIAAGGGEVESSDIHSALRNPELYVGGQPVNLVSSAATLAEQVVGLDVSQCAALPFWREFLDHDDRIAYWLEQTDPPGDDARAVARRVLAGFAATLFDSALNRGRLVVAVTHSPVLRAVAASELNDPGEPDYVTGLRLVPWSTGAVQTSFADPTTPPAGSGQA